MYSMTAPCSGDVFEEQNKRPADSFRRPFVLFTGREERTLAEGGKIPRKEASENRGGEMRAALQSAARLGIILRRKRALYGRTGERMSEEIYERVRRKLFGGHQADPFGRLLNDRAGIRGTVQGSPEEFSLVLYELTGGDLTKRSSAVSYQVSGAGRRDLLRFPDGLLFRVVKAKGVMGDPLIVVTPQEPAMDDLVQARELPLAALVQESLRIRDALANVAVDYRTEERKVQAEHTAREQRIARESTLDAALAAIERAKSGNIIMIRGIANIDELLRLGFTPGLVSNPDGWIDADDYPGLRYRHGRTGKELLLTGRERFRPIEELNRLEFHFLVNRSDDRPAVFARMIEKFRTTKRGDEPYTAAELHADLISLVKYPEELKGRTEEDLGLMAEEVGIVIDQRQELDKGILPYEAVFHKDTGLIIDFILRNRTPLGEVRKALDYFEYTGMIDQRYREQLLQQVRAAAAAGPPSSLAADLLHDKRVKEIVAEVLKKVPRERLTSTAITIALTPYVKELGFSRLISIRERILQLKEMVHDRDQ